MRGFSLSIKENQVLSSSIVWSLEKLEFLSAFSRCLAVESVASGAVRGDPAQGVARGSTIRGGYQAWSGEGVGRFICVPHHKNFLSIISYLD
jgi:hypothetical protein